MLNIALQIVIILHYFVYWYWTI